MQKLILSCLRWLFFLRGFGFGFGFLAFGIKTFEKAFDITMIATTLELLHRNTGRAKGEFHRAGVAVSPVLRNIAGNKSGNPFKFALTFALIFFKMYKKNNVTLIFSIPD